jgi:hypothetical protein
MAALWIAFLATGFLALFTLPPAEADPLPPKAPRPAAAPREPAPPQPSPSTDEVPVPEARPPDTPSPPPAGTRAHQDETDEPGRTFDPDPRSALPPRGAQPMGEEEVACRKRLRELGAVFEEQETLGGEPGCAVPYPVTLTRLSATIAIEPEAVLDCAMAEAISRFAATVVAPAAQEAFGSGLESVRHESAYVCRPRNGTTKLSEHAFGNALDIGGFTLAGGKTIDVKATTDAKEAGFLSRVRTAACGPFKTVLGPGANADHEFHFHFDLAKRRHGGTYCK